MAALEVEGIIQARLLHGTLAPVMAQEEIYPEDTLGKKLFKVKKTKGG